MTSQKPVTYHQIEEELATQLPHTKVPLREGTWAEQSLYPLGIDIFLHGNLLATMFPNQAVRLSEQHFVSAQCRNRMNDVLIPLGWKIKMDRGAWILEHRNGDRLNYKAGTMVTTLDDEGNERE